MNTDPVRGSRLGSASNESLEGVNFAPRQTIRFFCPEQHETQLIFAAEVELPETWDCKKCGRPALQEGLIEISQPEVVKETRSHFDFLLERRSRDELEEILSEALADLKKRREKEAS